MVALWLIAVALVVSAIVTMVHTIQHGLEPVGSSGLVTVPSDGITVYASHRPQIVDCTLTGGGQSVSLNALSYDFDATIDGRHVAAIGDTPHGLTPGLYHLTCPTLGFGTSLWTGDRLPILSIGLRILAGGLLVLAGFAVMIVLLVLRGRSKRRIRQHQWMAGYAGGGPGQGWPPAPPASPYGTPPPSGPYATPPPTGPYGTPPAYGPGASPPPAWPGYPPPGQQPDSAEDRRDDQDPPSS
jgi:hypothetical protein